jgi:hypothetical protein
MVASCPLAGAEMMTFLAPAWRCGRALSLSVKRPVHSKHDVDAELLPRELAGSFSASDLDVLAGDRELALDSVAVARTFARRCTVS